MQKTIFIFLFTLFATSCCAQKTNAVIPDLEQLVAQKRITAFNRNINLMKNAKNKISLYMNAKEHYGVAWLTGYAFSDGTLEFDVKGKDVLQQSFVGLAFHGVNNRTMDVIYFRPFNFQAPDAGRKSHSVQYVSLPEYDWQRLRTEHPDKYEQALKHPPQPDEWFHVRMVIKQPEVKVYVNNNPEPDLVVEQLGDRKGEMIGFWTGHQSDGNFANLKITPKKSNK